MDSNGKPTVEVELETPQGVFRDSAPSGVSTGKYEAKTVAPEVAVSNIKNIALAKLKGAQDEIDKVLKELNIGANAAIAVSMAVCRANAAANGISLWRYIHKTYRGRSSVCLPKPSFNMIEGGKHADSGLAFQEFMIVPQKESFRENLEIGLKVYKRLGEILGQGVGLSKEGAFSPKLENAFKAIDLILEAGQGEDIKIAIDAAGAKGESYQELIERYPIISIEDPFGEEDSEAWRAFKPGLLVMGDDLTTTSLERIKMAKEKDLCNAVIIKPNQIGTVTETIEAAKLAKSYDWKIMVSNRAGETMDDFIADLAVGIGADFIKSGAPFPKERMAKYNRLVEIEKEIMKKTGEAETAENNKD